MLNNITSCIENDTQANKQIMHNKKLKKIMNFKLKTKSKQKYKVDLCYKYWPFTQLEVYFPQYEFVI